MQGTNVNQHENSVIEHFLHKTENIAQKQYFQKNKLFSIKIVTMNETGSPTVSKIQTKTDPKQITFTVTKSSAPLWRRELLFRNFMKLILKRINILTQFPFQVGMYTYMV